MLVYLDIIMLHTAHGKLVLFKSPVTPRSKLAKSEFLSS